MRFRPRSFSLRQRLMLLVLIPVGALLGVGGIFLRSFYSEYRQYEGDLLRVPEIRQELADFAAFYAALDAERQAALGVLQAPGDAALLARYRAAWPATDQAVITFNAKLGRLAAGPQPGLFADRKDTITSFFASQIPAARDWTVSGVHSPGEVFNVYLKVAYDALLRTECYRLTFQSAQAINYFDGVLALLKLQLQESHACALVLFGQGPRGLAADALTILRRQFFSSTESEYYLLKFQPEVRAYFKDAMRGSEDGANFYTYLTAIAGAQRDATPLPRFKAQSGSVATVVAAHFAAYPSVFARAHAIAQIELAGLARGQLRRAWALSAALLFAVVISITAGLFIAYGTRGHLCGVGASIAAASDEVRSASTQLSAAGNQIAVRAVEWAEGIDRISATIGGLARAAGANRQHAQEAAAAGSHAGASVTAGLASIKEVEAAVQSARQSGQQITGVIARIDAISFQTNILALNAAVEAARAGAAGAGFAVVADEVRRLAHSCTEAARETAELIGQSTRDSANALARVDELAGRYKTISSGVAVVSDVVGRLSHDFVEQAASIEGINDSVAGQKGIAAGIADEAKATAATAQSMGMQVATLESSVDVLEQLVGGPGSAANGGVSSPPRPTPEARSAPAAALRRPRRWASSGIPERSRQS